ncbi:hypothetical protein [Terriglobus tenax]|uniref:hypothetical protein n=1 Tax=Terriglobus tenax TaxID=1111115 RepID=UPI0021E0BA0F|nr:hypothetical protein [Terriglobus tenax]
MKRLRWLVCLLLLVGQSYAQNWESRAKADLYGGDAKWQSELLAVKTSAKSGRVFVVMAGTNMATDGGFLGCHACAPEIGIAVYRKGVLELKDPQVTRFGAFGKADKDVDLLDLGGEEALLLRKSDTHQGIEELAGALFRVTDEKIGPLLWIDFGQRVVACNPKAEFLTEWCWKYTRELRIEKQATMGLADLTVVASGTRPDYEHKKLVPAETVRYRFDGLRYVPVGESPFDEGDVEH